jgi:hypothetical protein
VANAQRCREGNHRYEAVSGISAGLKRQKCGTCGSVMIDLTEDEGLDLTTASLFAARRATLFSVRETDETTTETFGRPRARR